MPKLNEEIKQQIKLMSKTELEKFAIKVLSKNKEMYDYFFVTFLDPKTGENDLYESAKNDIDLLQYKGYKGFSKELQLANMLSACTKRINDFSKVNKKKHLEADLLMYVLDKVFSLSPNMFGTCFTAFDYRVGVMLKRLINLVTTKLHPDYKINYSDNINKYLTQLHRTSGHIDTIYNLPISI